MSKQPARKGAALADAIALAQERAQLKPKPTKKAKALAGRIMYIECKGNEISGPARIGRVTFSKSGKSLYYQGRRFHTLSGGGFKANYFDWETGEHYWISGCKKRGGD